MRIQPIRGTHDLYGQELLKYKVIEKITQKFANIYGFEEVITPIFESSTLFQKPQLMEL